MKVIERHRCLTEYCNENTGFDQRALSMRLSNGMLYKGHIWVSDDDEGVRYFLSQKDNESYIQLFDIDSAVNNLRDNIDQLIEANKITEDMIKIIEGIPYPNQELMDLLKDVRGIGDIDVVNTFNNKLSLIIPCCRLVSYFGKTDEPQVVVCVKTLTVFTRSLDNLRERKYCAVCEKKKIQCARKHPSMNVPIYEYSNSESYPFLRKHNSIVEAIDYHGGVNTSASMSNAMDTIGASLFGILTNKTSSDQLNRVSRNNMIYSYYPPVKLNFVLPVLS